MKKFIFGIVSGIIAVGMGAALFAMPVAAQVGGGAQGGVEAARGEGVPTNLATGDGSIVQRAVNFMLYLVGVISVIMLIFGGFRYVISGGQKEAVTSAKNTILYAVVGLLVALFAYAIIRFVINTVIGAGSTTDV